LIKAARILFTLLLIGWVVQKAGLLQGQGRDRLWELISGIQLPFLAASLGIGVLLNLASAFKWQMLLKSQQIAVGLWRLFAYYIIGQFYNLILPTSMGGDVVRMHTLTRHCGDGYAAVASVFVERFTGMVTLVVLSAIAVLVNLNTFNLPLVTASLLGVTLLIALIGWLVLDPRPIRVFRRLFIGRVKFLNRLSHKIEQFQSAVAAYGNAPGALRVAFLNSLLFYFLAIINVWVTAKAFAGEIDVLHMVIATPVIMLIMNLPVSIGGLGLMEFAYVFTFELMGYGAALGLSTALLMRLKTLIDGLMGGIFQLLIPMNPPRNDITDLPIHGALDLEGKKE
jgi:uncharacterized protein (TIRG00374 family)